jgi:hypothetical protein
MRIPAPVKDQLLATPPAPSHLQLTLPFGHAYGAFGETGSDGLGGEVRAPFTFLRFKIRKHSDRFTGDVNTDSLGRPVCVADQSRHSASVEDAIKITTCRFCRIRELVNDGASRCSR